MTDRFKAVYTSGILIPKQSTVTALALLFDKIYIPNNIRYVKEYAKQFPMQFEFDKTFTLDGEYLSDLTYQQQKTVAYYIDTVMRFTRRNARLFGDVFETDLFNDGLPYDTKQVSHDPPMWETRSKKSLIFSGLEFSPIPDLVSDNYVPVVTHSSHVDLGTSHFINSNARSLAALLAMKSVQLVLPQTIDARPNEMILPSPDGHSVKP